MAWWSAAEAERVGTAGGLEGLRDSAPHRGALAREGELLGGRSDGKGVGGGWGREGGAWFGGKSAVVGGPGRLWGLVE